MLRLYGNVYGGRAIDARSAENDLRPGRLEAAVSVKVPFQEEWCGVVLVTALEPHRRHLPIHVTGAAVVQHLTQVRVVLDHAGPGKRLRLDRYRRVEDVLGDGNDLTADRCKPVPGTRVSVEAELAESLGSSLKKDEVVEVVQTVVRMINDDIVATEPTGELQFI